jgi:hypothetical protein
VLLRLRRAADGEVVRETRPEVSEADWDVKGEFGYPVYFRDAFDTCFSKTARPVPLGDYLIDVRITFREGTELETTGMAITVRGETKTY